MKCYLISRDLMFSSQVSGAAAQAGIEFQTMGTPADCGVPEEASVVILDLTMPGLNIESAIHEAAAITSTKIIAVGPHVQGEKLEAAKEAGAHFVLSKGQAHRELATVLKELQSRFG